MLLSMLLSVAVATPPSSAPAAERSCAEVIEGRVLDAATAEAIAEVTVELERPHQSALRTTTDDDGAFEISGLCPGSYRLRVSRADYEGAGRSVKAGSKPIAMTLEPHNVDVLDDVIVTAPAPQRLDAATRGSTIDGEDLDAVRGQSLADALASVPGVTVLRTPAGGLGKPIIRGHVGRRNLILYDGVRHESQKWGIDHAPEIDPFAADSISVLKGAGGIRYGPDAIGGVVLIDPPPLPTSPDTGSSVTGETHLIGVSNGLRGTTATRLQGAHAKLPGFAWRLEGNASRGAALITPDYPLDNTGSQIWNGGASLGYARRGFSIEGTYRHHDMKAGIFTGTLNDNPDQFEQALALRRPQSADLYNREYEIERPFQTVTHQLGLLRGRAPLGRFGDLVATYAVQVDDRDEFEIVRDNVSGPQRSFDLTTHAGELVFEHAPVTLGTTAYLEGSFGGGYTFRRNRYDGSDPAFLPDYRGHQAGVYALERLVFERVELEGGARYDGLSRRSVLNDKAYAPARVQGRLPNDCRETEDDGAVCYTPFQTGSGSLGVLFRPVATAREFFVRLDASTAVRFPTVDEQFMKGTTPSFPVFVNGDGSLGPERTWGGALTVGHATPWLFVEGSAYANYIDDYIYFRARPLSEEESQCAPLSCGTKGAFPLFEPGAVDALFYGGEVTGEVQPPKWPVSFDAQASWVRAFQLPGGEPLVFIPPDRYRLGITYHWPDIPGTDNGHVGVSGTFVDRQRRFDPDADFADPPPAYGLLGAEIGLDVPFSGQVFSAAVTGRNLANSRYRDYTSLLRYFANEPGWEVAVRLTLRFAFATPRARNTRAR